MSLVNWGSDGASLQVSHVLHLLPPPSSVISEPAAQPVTTSKTPPSYEFQEIRQSSHTYRPQQKEKTP